MKRLIGFLLIFSSFTAAAEQALQLKAASRYINKDKAQLVSTLLNFDLAKESEDEILFRYYLAQEFLCQITSEVARSFCQQLRKHEAFHNQEIKSLEGFELTPNRQRLIKDIFTALKVTFNDLPAPEKDAYQNAEVALKMAEAKAAAKRPAKSDYLAALDHLEPVIRFYQLTPTYRPYAHFLNQLRSWLASTAPDRNWNIDPQVKAGNSKLTCGFSAFRNLLKCTGPDLNAVIPVHIGLEEVQLRRMVLSVDERTNIACLILPKTSDRTNREWNQAFCHNLRPDRIWCQEAANAADSNVDYSRWNISEAPAYGAKLSCQNNEMNGHRVFFNRDFKVVGVVSDSEFNFVNDRNTIEQMLARPPKAALGANSALVGYGSFCSIHADTLTCSAPNKNVLNLLAFPRQNLKRLRVYDTTLCVQNFFEHWTCRVMPWEANIGPFQGLNGFLKDGSPVFIEEPERGRLNVTIGQAKVKSASELPRYKSTAPRNSPIVFEVGDAKIICGISDDSVSCRHLVSDQPVHLPGFKKGERLFNTLHHVCALYKKSLLCAQKSAMEFKEGAIQNKPWHQVQGFSLRELKAPDFPGDAQHVSVSEDVICAKLDGGAALSCIDTSSGQPLHLRLAPFDSILDLPRQDQFCLDTVKSHRCLSRRLERGFELEKRND